MRVASRAKTVRIVMNNVVRFCLVIVVLIGSVSVHAQTEFVFEEKPKVKVSDDAAGARYENSFQSLGILGMGMADGENPIRWFININNNSLISNDIGLYLEQQFMLQISGDTPYTFLGNGVMCYLTGTKRFGIIGKANIGVSFVSDIRNSSLFGSAITGLGSTVGLGFSGGEGVFAFHAMALLHQTSLLGGHIAPAGNVNILFRL